MDNNNVIYINGIETEITGNEWLQYLKEHHRPITEDIIEEVLAERR